MAHNLPLNGPELANYLALHLSDLEFELLIRQRIRDHFNRIHADNPNLSQTSHNDCSFTWSQSDKSEWRVGIGETYSKRAITEGEVLATTFSDVDIIMQQKYRNKLSLLLQGPDTLAAKETAKETANVSGTDEVPYTHMFTSSTGTDEVPY